MPSLITWNMQGGSASTEVKWQTGVANMLANRDPKPDYICLQEAGQVPDSAKLLETQSFSDPKGNQTQVRYYSWGGSSTQPPRGIAFHRWDDGANRVNTSVVTRELIPPKVRLELVWAAKPEWRPALGLWIGGAWIYSFHAISPGGPDAASLVAELAGRAGKEAWLLGADFNREPNSFALPDGGGFCEPTGPTYKVPAPTKKLDYFVSTIPPQGKGTVEDSIGLSDHYPVGFAF